MYNSVSEQSNKQQVRSRSNAGIVVAHWRLCSSNDTNGLCRPHESSTGCKRQLAAASSAHLVQVAVRTACTAALGHACFTKNRFFLGRFSRASSCDFYCLVDGRKQYCKTRSSAPTHARQRYLHMRVAFPRWIQTSIVVAVISFTS